MKSCLTVLLMAAVLGAVSIIPSNAEARNPAGGVNSPACKACIEKLKAEEGCQAEDIRDPNWNEGCGRAVVRSLKECKRECLE